MKLALYLILLGVLASIVRNYPFFFEIPLLIAIGAAYWLFFRTPEAKDK